MKPSSSFSKLSHFKPLTRNAEPVTPRETQQASLKRQVTPRANQLTAASSVTKYNTNRRAPALGGGKKQEFQALLKSFKQDISSERPRPSLLHQKRPSPTKGRGLIGANNEQKSATPQSS